MDTEQIKQLIKSSQGKFFSVKFIKRTNGQTRKMTARLGVTKYLKGGSKPFSDSVHSLITVYDCQAKGYRSIPLDAVIELKVNGVTYDCSDIQS